MCVAYLPDTDADPSWASLFPRDRFSHSNPAWTPPLRIHYIAIQWH